MRNKALAFLTLIFLFNIQLEAETLPPLPTRVVISKETWENYSRNVLEILFPNRLEFVRKIQIQILESDSIAENDVGDSKITITTRLIRCVNDQYEYAALLAHKMAHRLLDHKSSQQNGNQAVDWTEKRKEELEADIFSLLVSPRAYAVSSLLDRMIPEWVEEMKNLPKEEADQVTSSLFLRLNNIDNIFDSTSPKRLLNSCPLPKALPKKESNIRTWRKFAYKVLYCIFPGQEPQLRRVRIKVIKEVGVAENISRKNGFEIRLSIQILREILEDPEDLAVLLGHEFGHTIFRRDYKKDYAVTGLSQNYLEYIFRSQWEADIVAILPIYKGECHWAKILKKDFVPHEKRQLDIAGMEIDNKRVERLEKMCQTNY